MKKVVLAVGVESSGTRVLTRLLSCSDELEVIHRSVPYGRDWWVDPGPIDAAVVIQRAWRYVIRSQMERGHMDIWAHLSPYDKLAMATEHLFVQVRRLDVPFTMVTYADLIQDPQGNMTELWQWLKVKPVPVTEVIYNGNGRWQLPKVEA